MSKKEIEEFDQCFVVQTSMDLNVGLYVVEDDIFEGKVLEGTLENAMRFESFQNAEEFLKEMKQNQIEGEIKTARLYISID
ncbi:hypothetical protein [Exiguobacterium sp. s138]|uniref:hypothetical protein n=1 Tax=Exiguobacterium sp. s138 TaxID=2751202 RepID=UPI001BE70013|nr:hypothetical protein [Exiguobacterium sp. s138]